MRYHLLCWTVTEYVRPNGVSPVLAFLQGLGGDAKSEAIALLKLLGTHGAGLREPASKALGEGLFELRGRTSGVRVFYTFKPGRVVVLLDGLIKKRAGIPPRELERLRRLRKVAIA